MYLTGSHYCTIEAVTLAWRDDLSGILTPHRRRGVEILDDPHVDPGVVCRSLQDVARANTLFGGTHAALAELEPAFQQVRGHKNATLLDVGTGAGDIPQIATERAQILGISLETIGLDNTEELLLANKLNISAAVCADAFQLPFGDKSIDFVLASQILHHFTNTNAIQFLRELSRVARHRVIISDLRRSWFAAAGLWIASFPLGFHPVSRHDGVVSVMRGFTPRELQNLVKEAVGQSVVVHRRIGFRITTSWGP